VSTLELLESRSAPKGFTIRQPKKTALSLATSPLQGEVTNAIAGLKDLDREELAERWRRRFGVMPPKGCGRALLELAAAYEIQERAFGGLNPETKKALAAAWRGSLNGASPHPPKSRVTKPGTRLVREWNGKTHHVEAVDGGFLWNDKVYRSLSTIAKAITGTHWSGPRFFGT